MLPQLPADKANHFVYGVGIALAILAAGQSIEVATLATAVVAFAKEGLDALQNYLKTGNWKTGPHGVEILDALATAAGGFCVFLAHIL